MIGLRTLGLHEIGLRHAGIAFPLLAAGVAYAGAVWLFPASQGLLAGFLSAAFALWNWASLRSTEMAPHQAFAALSLAALILLAKMIATGRCVYWYWAVAVSAVAFAEMDMALILVMTLLVTGWVERKRLGADGRFAAKSILLLISLVALLWPAAIYKLSFLKGYAFMAYQVLSRKVVWENLTAADVWRMRLTAFPVEWLLIATGLLLLAFLHGLHERRRLYPLAVYAALMLVVVARVSSTLPRYLLTFQPELLVLAGFMIAAALTRLRPATGVVSALALATGLFANTAIQNHLHPVTTAPRGWEEISFLRANHLENSTLLVPYADLPTIHCYFPHTTLRRYLGTQPTSKELARGPFAAIIYPDQPLHIDLLPGSK